MTEFILGQHRIASKMTRDRSIITYARTEIHKSIKCVEKKHGKMDKSKKRIMLSERERDRERENKR